jgi:hypothetical protein
MIHISITPLTIRVPRLGRSILENISFHFLVPMLFELPISNSFVTGLVHLKKGVFLELWLVKVKHPSTKTRGNFLF